MKDFGAVFRRMKFQLFNGIINDEQAVEYLMKELSYSEKTARSALNGIKNAKAKADAKRKEKDMRTKVNRTSKKNELTAEQIEHNYNERGRLLKGETERLLALAKEPLIVNEAKEPLDAFLYPKDDVFENMDNEQIITLGVGIGTWILMLLDRHLPEHTMLARKDRIGEVQRSIMQLANGLGKPLSEEALDYWCGVWNLTWNMAMDKIKTDYDIEG